MEASEFIRLTKGNIPKEHICCAFSDKKCTKGYEAKKAWLESQFDTGYTFRKLDARGKVFIEYVPAEEGWMPIIAPDYMLINCFWVSGRFKGHGYAKQLLDFCEKDSANKNGMIVVTGGKKRPFMSDTKFFKYFGFEKLDSAPPYFELWCKKLKPDAPDPKFRETAKSGECPNKEGLTVYYSNACPYTDYYMEVEYKRLAKEKALPLKLIKIETKEQAQQLPAPFFIHSIFYEGKFLTQEILGPKKWDKMF